MPLPDEQALLQELDMLIQSEAVRSELTPRRSAVPKKVQSQNAPKPAAMVANKIATVTNKTRVLG